ncbi:MAG: hypothetical protein CVU44_11200 [Chloroflexi bacterium HGW-Chloroflexi-6]|nr:MAG: hypothetical protein CVU44_11200 [Chloroflexi bacterium HGW-Chloroflexi-6]
MSRFYGFSLLVIVFLAGCVPLDVTQPTTTPVVGVVDASVELIRQDMYLRLTQQSIENERIEAGARMTATQQVIDATATQQVRSDNAIATERSAEATQQVWQVTVMAAQAADTATAQANATAAQAMVLGTTATVQAAGTATAVEQTQQAPIVAAKSTAMFAQARQTEIELQKSTATMWVSAWGGWVFAVVVIVIAAFVIWKKSQVGVIPTDSNGRPQMVVINQGGQKILVSPSLMASPMLAISNQGGSMPMLVNENFQKETTHGAQIIEAVRSLPPGYNRQGLSLAGGLTGPQQAGSVNIQVVQPGQLDGIRHELDAKLTEEDE